MIKGFSAPDFNFSKISYEVVARKMLDQYPQFSQILRTTGEGSQDFNFFQDRAYIDGFLNLAKYLDVPVIIVLNGYWEQVYTKFGSNRDRAEIARKSNLAIINEVLKSGLRATFAISNETYTKRELLGWTGTWTYETKANLTNLSMCADQYFWLVGIYEKEIPAEYKIAIPMATDLNKARIAWDTAMFQRMNKGRHVLDAHIYPSRNLTGTALADLIKKRLGRGFGTGAEIIVGECNSDMGMYGTEKIDPFSKSPKHLAHLNSIIGEVEKYASVVCVHKLGSIQPNNYSMIQFAA